MKTKGLKKVKRKYKGYILEYFVDPNMRDLSNEPFFKEQKQRAIEFLKKHPIPKELLKSK